MFLYCEKENMKKNVIFIKVWKAKQINRNGASDIYQQKGLSEHTAAENVRNCESRVKKDGGRS